MGQSCSKQKGNTMISRRNILKVFSGLLAIPFLSKKTKAKEQSFVEYDYNKNFNAWNYLPSKDGLKYFSLECIQKGNNDRTKIVCKDANSFENCELPIRVGSILGLNLDDIRLIVTKQENYTIMHIYCPYIEKEYPYSFYYLTASSYEKLFDHIWNYLQEQIKKEHKANFSQLYVEGKCNLWEQKLSWKGSKY